MQKIAGAGATAQNTFTKGDPATGVPATEVTQEWLNTMQAELVYIVEQAGLTLDALDNRQVKVAIDMMIAAQGAAVRQQSTSAQAIAGTNATTDMSPARVKEAILALGGMAGAAPEVAAGRTNSVKRADGTWSARVRDLPQDYPLQTWADDLSLGAYDVNLTVAQNGLPVGWWYIEVMRHINDTAANQFRYLRATPLDATLASQPVYHCSVVGSAWTAWTPVGDNPLTWYTPTFVNSWADYAGLLPARYTKDLTTGLVHMKGLVKGGSNTLDTTIFTLPVGMRPATVIVTSQVTANGSCRLNINNLGFVYFSGSDIHTGNATQYLSITATFKGEL